MWVEFVVGSRLAPRVFLQVRSDLVFLPPQKPKLQIPIRPGQRTDMKTSYKADVTSSLTIVNIFLENSPEKILALIG